ncbi:MAG TPA: response regulator, partial [Candidatus Acidoferrum sp.]|nr:response regulator [Candidatus Acidoferrum sp.]
MNQTSQATNAVSEAQRGIRYRVLIVEDDADIRELIRYNLAQEGFIVEEAPDGAQALDKVKRRVPDLMVLDLMLPGMPGLQVCRQMRAERETAHLPILIVTAKGTEVDKVLGLEMGADDYVVKPFSPRELVARVKAVLRRFERPLPPSPLKVGEIEIDPSAMTLTVAGKLVATTATEFR